VIDGRIHRGATGSAAEIGHLILRPGGRRCGCGGRGHLEAYASATAVARRGREAARREPGCALAELAPEEITAAAVSRAAREGDEAARRILEETWRHLGLGLATVVDVLDPDVVVLCGGLAREGRSLVDAVRRTVREEAFGGARRVRVALHRLGDRAGILGAAACAEEAS
jgi:glucokinase